MTVTWAAPAIVVSMPGYKWQAPVPPYSPTSSSVIRRARVGREGGGVLFSSVSLNILSMRVREQQMVLFDGAIHLVMTADGGPPSVLSCNGAH